MFSVQFVIVFRQLHPLFNTLVLQVNMQSSCVETQSFINMVTFSVRFFGGRTKRSYLIKKSYP